MRGLLVGRSLGALLVPVLAVLLLMAAGFVVQSRVTTSAFDRLEAGQVEQDAQRVRIGLDSWVRLLRSYGATNSIWDGSYADVTTGDDRSFVGDFPPADVKSIYGLDGVLGVGPDGRLRVGGLVDGQRYVPPPDRLAAAATLVRLFDPTARAGASRCSVVDSGAGAYLACGFVAHRSDGTRDGAATGAATVAATGAAPGAAQGVTGGGAGLIFLRSLGGAGLGELGAELSMPLSVAAGPGAGGSTGVEPDVSGWSRVASSLGVLRTSTRPVGRSQIALQVALPVGNGSPVVLQAVRPRPIHAEAVRVSGWLMLVTGAIGLVVLAVVLTVSRWEVRRQVGPLRRITHLMTSTGDRSVRAAPGRGEIGALGQDINAMLDAIVEQDRQLLEASAGREEQARQARVQQQQSATVIRERAQSAVDDTVRTVLRELDQVVRRADAVTAAAAEIDQRVGATTTVTADAHSLATEGAQSTARVTSSLEHVSGITQTIGAVARQTHLLALNATIEAARAGAAGRGFTVVAHEVKQLAGHTAASAQQISQTLARLDTDVCALTDVISRMSRSVAGIDQETTHLLGVTADQRDTLDALRDQLQQTSQTIAQLGDLSQTIERRGHERIPLTGRVQVTAADSPGTRWAGTLVDLSQGGLRCRLPDAARLAGGSRVSVAISTNHGDATVDARVLRRTPTPTGTDFGLSLIDPTHPDVAAILTRASTG